MAGLALRARAAGVPVLQRPPQVEFWQPAVIRQRKLAALTFGYQYAGQPDFGLQSLHDRAGGLRRDTVHDVPSEGLNVSDVPKLHHLDLDRGYAVVMPSASRDDKLWPEDDWRVVFRRLRDAGCALKLLAGNEQEAERAVCWSPAWTAPRSCRA